MRLACSALNIALSQSLLYPLARGESLCVFCVLLSACLAHVFVWQSRAVGVVKLSYEHQDEKAIDPSTQSLL